MPERSSLTLGRNTTIFRYKRMDMDNMTAAAIVLAIRQYIDAMNHDKESYIITIRRK